MNILAIETATEACSVALHSGADILYRDTAEPRAHAAVLTAFINELMAEAGLSPSSLDAVAFGRGPGAFTGVRIATAAAQAIAVGVDIPALPVSTLALVAQQALRLQRSQRVAVAMDARMGEIYWGCYQSDGELMQPFGDEQLLAPNAVALPDTGVWVPAGSGWRAYAEALESVLAAQHCDVTLPHAQDILTLAVPMLQRGEGVAPERALPVYLRNDVAQTEAQRNSARRD